MLKNKGLKTIFKKIWLKNWVKNLRRENWFKNPRVINNCAKKMLNPKCKALGYLVRAPLKLRFSFF